jgi:gliding motility-associated-like protein
MLRKTLTLLFLLGGVAQLRAQVAQFTSDKTTGCFPLTVSFTDQSTGSVGSWSWNFGNGNTSTLQNPSAVYTAPGTYNVTLTINGSGDTETKTGYIVVRDFPSGDFTFDKNAGCAPLQVQFTNSISTTSGQITDWLWVFGDGGTSDQANPSYTFTEGGQRSISLKVTNQFGCETTLTKASAIEVNGPSVDFTPSVLVACQVPQLVEFTNLSSGNGVLTYSWNFGDGGTSTALNSSHTFTQPGVYPVRLTVTDPQGCVGEQVVNISMGGESGLDFTPSAIQVCRGESVSFTIQADEPIISLQWDFGNNTVSSNLAPSISYSQPGNYVVTLTAQLQDRDCQSIVSKTITVVQDAVPSFTSSVNCSGIATLTSTSTGAQRVQWFINGLLVSVQNTHTRSFAPGDHTVILIAFNAKDCPAVLERTVHVPQLPVAVFTPSLDQHCTEPSLSGCAPFPVQFKNESVSESTFTSQWSLGENVTSTLKDPPLRTFTNPGNFTVRLIVTDVRGCKDTTSAIVRVSNTIPVAAFTFDKNNVCVKEPVAFTSQSLNADFLCWDFGDGVVISGMNPQHAYEMPGVYTVTLTAKNAGCSNALVRQNVITVKDPFVDFMITKSCDDPFHVELLNLSTNANTFQWELGDGSVTSAASFGHTYASTGLYTIKLTGINQTTNCTVPVEKAVIIQDIRADFTLESLRPCKDVAIPATDQSDFASSWTWLVDDIPFAYTKDAVYQASIAGEHTIKLAVTDSDGCNDEKAVEVIVPDITGNFSYTAVSNCDQFEVQFADQSTSTPPLQSWHWDFGDNATVETQNPKHIYEDTGSYDVTLTLSNGIGECDFVKTDIIVFAHPRPDFSVADPNACIGELVLIANNSTGAVSYQWELGGGLTSSSVLPFYSYSHAGSYNVTLRATDIYGCEVSLTKPNAVIIHQPTADFAAFQTSAECPPLTSVFDDNSIGSGLRWSWDFGNGITSFFQNPANVYERPGLYDVTLRVTDQHGCFDVKTIDDLIEVGGPSGEITGIISEVCATSDVHFEATTSNTETHRWDFGDGMVVDSPDSTAAHTYQSPGSYHPSLVLIDNQGCEVVADGSTDVIVHDLPSLDLTFGPDCIFEGELLVLNSTAENLTFDWYINGTALGEGSHREVLMETAGPYEIKVIGTNEFNCVTEFTAKVNVQGKITTIPNVFTANGDEFNQNFVIPGIEKSDWTLHVYNRWGKKVYVESYYRNGWSGAGLAAGTYYYTVENQICTDRSYKGFLTVVK